MLDAQARNMHITIAAIGQLGRGEEASLTAEYSKRSPWNISVKELTCKQSLPTEKRKAAETALLLNACSECQQLFALDEKGKTLTSQQFATTLQRCQMEGLRVGFLIGGADGLDRSALPKHCQSLAFGTFTWPHKLVRVMLAEQLYRAWSILEGHPYHRE